MRVSKGGINIRGGRGRVSTLHEFHGVGITNGDPCITTIEEVMVLLICRGEIYSGISATLGVGQIWKFEN